MKDEVVRRLEALSERYREWASSTEDVRTRDSMASRLASETRELLPWVLLALREN